MWYADIPSRPWKIIDSINEDETKGFIHIAGANGEKVCDIFPFAGVGGIGVIAARKVASIIIEASTELIP